MSSGQETVFTMTSFDALRRPLRYDEYDALWDRREVSAEDLFAALDGLDLNDTEVEREVISGLVSNLIYEMLAARMLDPRRGPIPRFVRQIDSAVEHFNKQLG